MKKVGNVVSCEEFLEGQVKERVALTNAGLGKCGTNREQT